ncbi:MAG: hypothetical protein ACOH1I_05030 [Gallionellaceae bacterium]
MPRGQTITLPAHPTENITPQASGRQLARHVLPGFVALSGGVALGLLML